MHADVDRQSPLGSAVNTDLFGNPLRPAEPAEVDSPEPRGLLDDGLVRTTGWVQLGDRPVSSGAVCALLSLPHAVVVAIALRDTSTFAAILAVMLLPLIASGIWLLANALLPASKARNVEVLRAGDLTVGQPVRLYGSIGVVGRIRAITAVSEDAVEVRFAGGTTRTWVVDHQVHAVELLD